MSQKSKVDVLYLEVVDQNKSGFILDGTQGTAQQQELTAPSVQWIYPTGKTSQMINGVRHDIEIRFINGCDTIDKKEQEQRGFVPNRFEDKIAFENGFATVYREGSTIGLYDFLKKAYYNQDNPDRPASATARYREVKLDKQAAEFIDDDEIETKAKMLVFSLRKKVGSKTEEYNEEKMDMWCRIFQVTEETPQRKMVVLHHQAKKNPALFIQMVEQAEQIIITEITHGLELDVIVFDDNVALYKNGNSVIKSLGSGKMKQAEKITNLADWFGSPDGSAAYHEFRTHLETAKENKLK